MKSAQGNYDEGQQKSIQTQKYHQVNPPVQLIQTQQPQQKKQETTQQVMVAGEMYNSAAVENDDPGILYCWAIVAFFCPVLGLIACCCCTNGNLGPKRQRGCHVLGFCTVFGFIAWPIVYYYIS